MTVFITGNTYSHREILKATGWRWDAAQNAWKTEVDAALADAARRKVDGAAQEMAKTVHGNRHECLIYALEPGTSDRVVLWTARTYAAWAQAEQLKLHDLR